MTEDWDADRPTLGGILRERAMELQEEDPNLGADEALELARSLTAIERGMEDVRAGRGQPMREALREIADELGLELDR